MKGIQVCSNEGSHPFPRGDDYEIAKIPWRNLKIFFTIPTGPISTKLGTKYPWVKGIHVCSNEGPNPSPRGDNNEIAKIHWRNSKIFFSRTTEPISTNFGTKHPWIKGNQVCSNEGPHPFPRGHNYERVKIHWQNLKSSSPEPLDLFQPNLAQSILGWRGFKIVQMKNQ